MKKLLSVLTILLCLLLFGCNKKIKCEVNVYRSGINTRDYSIDPVNHKSVYDLLDEKCYLFKEYEDFEKFINDNDLVLSEEIESKYSKEFFKDKSFILHLGTDPSSGYQYKFNLYKEENVLKLNIEKSIDRRFDYPAVVVNRLFLLDIDKDKIADTNEFIYSTSVSD